MRVLAMAVMIGLAHAATAADRPVEIAAHRGESADAPENTLASFKLAWERGVKTIELDVHLTKDGELLLSHDPDTKRTTGVEGKIKDRPLSELRGLDAGSWKDAKWKNEKLPTLGEVLATIPDGGRCFIEIKEGPEAVPAVAKAVAASGKKPDQLVIIAFKAPTIIAAKKAMPQLKAYFLSSFKKDKDTGAFSPTIDRLITQAKAMQADGLNVSYQGPLDREGVAKIKAAGLACLVWTVDDAEIAKRFVDYGVDGVTTNKAAWMAGQLRGPTR